MQAGGNPKCRICRHRIHNRGHDGEVCAPSVPVFVPTRSFLARGFAAISWVPAAPLGQLQTHRGSKPGATTSLGAAATPSPFVSPPRISLLPSQMLQLRRAGPPRQRVQAPAAAQEMPLLPEHQPHGRQLPGESAAVPQLAGKACLLPRGGGHAQLAPAPRNPGMMAGGGRGYHRDGEALARQRAATGARRRERGGEAAAPFPPRSPLLIGVAPKMVGGALGAPLAGEKRNTFASSLFSTKPGRRVPGRRSREAASQGGSRGSLLPLPRARRREGRGRQSWGTPTGRPRGSPSSSLTGLPASKPRSWAAGRLRGLQVLKPAAGVLLVVFPSGKRNPAGAPARRLFHVEQTHTGHEYSSCPCRVPETDGPWAQPAQGQREKGTRVSAAALVPPRCPPALPLFIGPGDNEFYNFILPGPAAPCPCRSQRQVKAALGCAWMTYLWVCLSSFFFFF